ncbi:hypothetical protein [Chroococcidiopsis sp. CCMEE 29]|uniref:hypothetical protein n=1 Tax=Chroococcidiopsis sp. CCMEE 29 TaxID=155894 RepID=UPI002021C037|nr:hypothetical protein [Chroococcidiopsis sp. CCMEE 29]
MYYWAEAQFNEMLPPSLTLPQTRSRWDYGDRFEGAQTLKPCFGFAVVHTATFTHFYTYISNSQLCLQP